MMDHNKLLFSLKITVLFILSSANCLRTLFPTMKAKTQHHRIHHNHQNRSKLGLSDFLSESPTVSDFQWIHLPSFSENQYESVHHRIRRHNDEDSENEQNEGTENENEDEGEENENEGGEDDQEVSNSIEDDIKTKTIDVAVKDEEWTKLKDRLRKQLDEEDSNGQIELLRIARKTDPTFYYRKPGEECLTDAFIKSEIVRLNETGNITHYQRHLLERKRCFFYTKTYCAKVEPRSQTKFARDGKHHVEYRCICIPGRTWEDSACSSYHDQDCWWDSDCVQNAICLFEDDRKRIANLKELIAAKREARKKEREKKLAKLFPGTEDKQVEEEEDGDENADDDYEDNNSTHERQSKIMGKKFIKLTRKKRDDHDEFIHTRKLDKEKQSGHSAARKYEKESSGLQTRRLHGHNGGDSKPRKVYDRIRNWNQKFLVGKCICDAFRKCQRTSLLPPFVETAGAVSSFYTFNYIYYFVSSLICVSYYELF